MNARLLQVLALAGSAGLLLGALAFQYVGGLAPCQMCIWQRWPHVVALGAALGFVIPSRVWALLGAGGAGTSGAIGVFHTGVERGWWEGITACSSGGNMAGLTPEQVLEQIMTAPVVRCDQVPWEMFGLSMASWNAVLSFGVAALWLASLRARG